MNENKNELFSRPVWQMTGAEMAELFRSVIHGEAGPATASTVICSGTKELAAHLACSESTIYALRRDGVLEDAVVSQIGRRIVYNVERARELANNYLEHTRKYNKP